MKGNSIDLILDGAKKAVEENIPTSPAQWLDAAQRLNALIQNLDEELVNAEITYRRIRSYFIEEGKSASESETRAKSSEEYGQYLKLKAKKDQVEGFIQIAKKRCDVRNM